ncbi:DNA methyltransferase [Dactylosporangium sp. CA-139066]|uniref:DNA methyltransferase n=1 Tax=Dactylosporangium sp. CA-139066 TaxID=3239930 RepID=UPI003D8B9ADF
MPSARSAGWAFQPTTGCRRPPRSSPRSHGPDAPLPGDLLIRYAGPPGGIVVDPFAGSGSTRIAARAAGRRAALNGSDERYCDRAAHWLAIR